MGFFILDCLSNNLIKLLGIGTEHIELLLLGGCFITFHSFLLSLT